MCIRDRMTSVSQIRKPDAQYVFHLSSRLTNKIIEREVTKYVSQFVLVTPHVHSKYLHYYPQLLTSTHDYIQTQWLVVTYGKQILLLTSSSIILKCYKIIHELSINFITSTYSSK